jgi:hypothetical protein
MSPQANSVLSCRRSFAPPLSILFMISPIQGFVHHVGWSPPGFAGLISKDRSPLWPEHASTVNAAKSTSTFTCSQNRLKFLAAVSHTYMSIWLAPFPAQQVTPIS